MPDYILGISAYYHDSAAAILKNDEIIAAAHEERFTSIMQVFLLMLLNMFLKRLE